MKKSKETKMAKKEYKKLQFDFSEEAIGIVQKCWHGENSTVLGEHGKFKLIHKIP